MNNGGSEMERITASLERSLRNININGADSAENNITLSSAVDLNSHISLPYHWEQCLDLKVYYRNWRTGMMAKEDPRTTNGFYSEEDEEDDDEDDGDDSSYDSEGSSSESLPISYPRDHQIYQHDQHHNGMDNKSGVDKNKSENVLVVAGCKRCLMYFMVPKQDSVCSKCCGQLLHFDQSENGSV